MTKNAKIMNIEIIGPGRVADRHASAISQTENARLWSVVGRHIEDTQDFVNKYDTQASVFVDISEMLADPQLDAVIIAYLTNCI